MTEKHRRIHFVTGANGGIGRAVARKFLEEDPGCRVWLGVRVNREHADALMEKFPGRADAVVHEAADPNSWSEVIRAIVSHDGRIDVLVNNAGFHSDSLLATMSDGQWRGVMSANLDSVFFGCRAVVTEMMKTKFGRIINIASLSALLPPRGQANYAAAKAGVVAMSQALAKEVARAGITVNCLCPGYVDTAALAGIDDIQRKKLKKSIPMRRFGTPDEIASAAHFLACPQAGYITGSVLKIDGGIL